MNHVLAQDLVNGYVVSTIYVPPFVRQLDDMIGAFALLVEDEERFPSQGAPPSSTHPYETMVFPANEAGEIGDYSELACQRYLTEEEARRGHAAMVEMWQGGVVA